MANNKNDTGAFFVNSRKDLNKKEDEKKPDFTGSITLDDHKHYLSVWKRTAQKTGNTFYSILSNKANTDFSYKDPDKDNNKGVLFTNNKPNGDNPPLLTGRGKFDGNNYYLDVWEVQGKEQTFFSIKLKKYEVKENDEFNQEKQTDDTFNQEIPFDVDQKSPNDEYNQETPSSTAFNIFTLGQE